MSINLSLLFTVLFLVLSMITSAHAELNLSGYFDMEHHKSTGNEPSFRQHHLNLMMEHEVRQFKFFSEIEFEDGVSIEDEREGDGAVGKGLVTVERAWAEAFVSKYLIFRGGILLNPTLYQQNHYPSIVVDINRPQLVKNIFDGDMEGIHLRGATPFGLNYLVWTERGSQEVEEKSFEDSNGDTVTVGHSEKKATYGDALNTGWRVGYANTFADMTIDAAVLGAQYAVAPDGKSYYQKAIGAELNFHFKDFTLWSEWGAREDKNHKGNTKKGYYLIASYDIESAWGEFIPFLKYDSYRKNSSSIENVVKKGFGLTYRPDPVISLKAEWLKTDEYLKSSSVTPKSETVSLAFVYFYN